MKSIFLLIIVVAFTMNMGLAQGQSYYGAASLSGEVWFTCGNTWRGNATIVVLDKATKQCYGGSGTMCSIKDGKAKRSYYEIQNLPPNTKLLLIGYVESPNAVSVQTIELKHNENKRRNVSVNCGFISSVGTNDLLTDLLVFNHKNKQDYVIELAKKMYLDFVNARF